MSISLLLFKIVIIVLVYSGAPSPTQQLCPTPHTCSDLTQYNQHIQRCNLSYHPSAPGLTSPVPAPHHPADSGLNLFYHAQKSAPFTLCSQCTRQQVLIAFSRTLILLLLCSSGDVEFNPGPACPQALSFVDFCN